VGVVFGLSVFYWCESVSFVNRGCVEVGCRFKVGERRFSVRVYSDLRRDGDVHFDVVVRRGELSDFRGVVAERVLLVFKYAALYLRALGFDYGRLVGELRDVFRVDLRYGGTEFYCRGKLIKWVPCSLEYALSHSGYGPESLLEYLEDAAGVKPPPLQV